MPKPRKSNPPPIRPGGISGAPALTRDERRKWESDRTMKAPTTSDFSAELREKFPRKAIEADHGSSRASAIHLNCRECIQASSAADCPATTCFLFPFRPGADSEGARQRKPGDVPTREQYAEMLRLRDPDGVKADAARKRFGHVVDESATDKCPPFYCMDSAHTDYESCNCMPF